MAKWWFKYIFIKKKLSFEEQFETVMDEEIKVDKKNKKTSFLTSFMICHQGYAAGNEFQVYPDINMQNVSYMFVSTSRYPDDHSWERGIALQFDWNTTLHIILSIHSYYLHLLPSPFPDRCVDFSKLPFKNVYHAMYNCTEKDGNDTRVSERRMVTKVDEHLRTLKRSNKSVVGDCGKYQRNECNSQAIFTQMVSKNTPKERLEYLFQFIDPLQPSTVVTSNAKIGFVDLITYVFGALGTWIGFSFLQLNPVPHLVTVARKNSDWNYNKSHKNILRILKCNERKYKNVNQRVSLLEIRCARRIL